jgi:hypothetical protein
MSLFNRLLKLKSDDIHRLEDFFTEIVAHFLESNPDALKSWLKFSGITDDNNWTHTSLVTQKTYQHPDKGEEKYSDKEKRPDIVVELSNENANGIIFLESKVGSQEGHNQLKDYAKVLESLTGYQQKHLVYITRDFEPKDVEKVLKDIRKGEVYFTQLRWHHFYQFLCTLPESTLTREIQLFMQEHGMAQSNQFSAIDVLALTNFSASLKLMEQVMWG